jgi:hypothetical protein
MLLALLLAQLLPANPEGPIVTNPATMSRPALFEAFRGPGTFGPCSTTPPTGAKGEALTFTRGSNGTCTKTATGGLATTGIANGDLVVLSSNQPRVEYDANGVLGLLVESSRTNSCLRSEQSDNAVWQKLSSGAAAPVVTADTAVAPDGTTTADTAAFPAVSTASNYSDLLQNITLTAASWTYSEFVKGVSGSGRLYVMCTPDGVTYFRAACDYNSTTWTRCAATGTATALGWFCGLGVDLRDGSQAAQGVQSVYRWGMGAEAGAFATSYIPTVAAGVTRSAETAASYTLPSGIGPNGCIAASATWPSASVGAVNIAAFGSAGAGNNWTLYRTSNTAAGYQIGVTTTAPAIAAANLTTHRTVLSDNAGTRAAWWDAASVAAPAASLSGTQTIIWIGAGVSSGTPIDGIISRFQLDPDPSRCR